MGWVYNGQELVDMFQTTQGDVVFASCEVGIDPALPLFQWIDHLAASIQAG